MFKRLGVLVVIAIAIAGCKPPPDPNDPADVGIMDAAVLMRNLKWSSTVINERVARGEITDAEGKEILAKYADEIAKKVDTKNIIPQNAWQYGDVFRVAKRWDLAKPLLEMAVQHAEKTKNEDRRVNDLLRLAQTEASLGNLDKAIEYTRKTFTAPPAAKAPILYGVLYEVVPAAEGKKKDVEIAKLLEDAIDQHNQVLVDPRSDAGISFLAAKGHHLSRAWQKVFDLLTAAGKPDLLKEARQRAVGQMTNQRQL